jgi:O-antigen/teichoic acid export membrane protein
MTVNDTAGRWLPPRVSARLALVHAQAQAIITERDEHAQAQRMALIAFCVRVLSAAIAFATQIVLARLMGEFEYGIFVFVWALAVIFGNLSCFGFHTTVIRFLPGYRDQRAFAAINGLTQTARRVAMASATAIALIGFAVLHFFGGSIDAHYLVPLFLGLVTLPMIALGDVLDGTARANNWPLFGLGATFLLRPALILAFMWVAVVLGFDRSAETALYAALAATYLTSLCQYLAVTARLRRRYEQRDTSIAFSQWFKVALPIFFIEGFYFLLTNADVIVVAFFVPPDQVAVYFAAAKTMALVHFVYYAVKAGAAPRFAQLVSAGDKATLAAFARQTIAWTFWPSLIVGLTVFAAGPFLLSLFGPAFTQGHVLMGILLLGIMAKALVGPGEVLLTMAGEQKVCALVYLAVLLANIAFSITLIPIYGLEGAAIATASAMALEAMLLTTVVRRRLGISMFILTPARKEC